MATAIPHAAAERILRLAGAKRVSDEAKEAMADVVEDIGRRMSEQAVRIARNCGRKTVNAEDIKMVKL